MLLGVFCVMECLVDDVWHKDIHNVRVDWLGLIHLVVRKHGQGFVPAPPSPSVYT